MAEEFSFLANSNDSEILVGCIKTHGCGWCQTEKVSNMLIIMIFVFNSNTFALNIFSMEVHEWGFIVTKAAKQWRRELISWGTSTWINISIRDYLNIAGIPIEQSLSSLHHFNRRRECRLTKSGFMFTNWRFSLLLAVEMNHLSM